MAPTPDSLSLFANRTASYREHAPQNGAGFFALSPLNALPKIALGKWGVEDLLDYQCLLLTDAGGTTRVMPYGERALYWQALVHVGTSSPLSLVPAWAQDALGRTTGQPLSKQHDEYVMETSSVVAMPGGRNAAVRGNTNKARRLTTVESLSPENLSDALALNALWYRQNKELKFRPYDKTSIDWLLNNWGVVQEACPDAVALVVRDQASGRPLSLNMGCLLARDTWTAYTQRFDRDAPIKAANALGYRLLGEAYAEAYPDAVWENDGTADTKTIREWKDRLYSQKLSAYQTKRNP